jgi:hypothetical protein
MGIRPAEKYDAQRIEMLRNMLAAFAQNGTPYYYEIHVDGLPLVPKTNNIENFDNYQQYVNDTTKKIQFIIYSDNPNDKNKDWHVFTLKPDTESLNGIADTEKILDEKLKLAGERMESKKVQEKLEDTQKQLQDAEDYIGILEERLEIQKVKPNHFGNLDLGKFTGALIETIVRRNPKLLATVPGLEGIAEAYSSDDTKSIESEKKEGEAVFTKKDGINAKSNLTEEEQGYLEFGKQVAENFEDDEITLLAKIVEALGKDTSQLKLVAELLNVKF